MQKQPPSIGSVAAMIVFALSCFGLLTFLWTSFGGPIPLAAEGYRLHARFDEATQLADNADVRISGVTVGRVIGSELDRDRTNATIEIDEAYAPVPSDTKAILRSKTLLGETYVELTPGDRGAEPLPDGGTLPDGQVRPTVELDEILAAFDPRTRRALRQFVQGTAKALRGRAADLNASVGNLSPFASDTGRLLDLLEGQDEAVRRLVRDTGTVFDAIGRRQGELSGLVEAVGTVLDSTAAHREELRRTVEILPTTLRELRPTLGELEALAREAAPVVRDLRPAGRALEPALRDTAALAPELEGLFRDLDPLISLSRTALPATTRTVEAAHPLFRALDPLLAELVPVLDYAGLFEREVTAAFANVAAATQASVPPVPGADPLHYVRIVPPSTAEGAVVADERYASNRHNPYFAPGALAKLAEGLESFDCSNTNNELDPQAAPPCLVQDPIEFRGKELSYPHVERDP